MDEAVRRYQSGERVIDILAACGIASSTLYRELRRLGIVRLEQTAEERRLKSVAGARSYRATHPTPRVRRIGLDLERDKATRAARARRERAKNPEPRRVAVRKWRVNHLKEARAGERASYAAHRDERRATLVLYRGRHREEARAATRRWRLANPEQARAGRRRHSALKRGAPGAGITAVQWHAILEAFAHRCAYCGSSGQMTQDHVLPVSRGGAHDAANIVPACRTCNSSKSARTPEEWMAATRYDAPESREDEVMDDTRAGFAVGALR